MNFMQATEMLELLRSIDRRLKELAGKPAEYVAQPQYGRSTAAPPEAQINAVFCGSHAGTELAFRMKPDAAGRMVPDQTQASPDFLPGEDVG